jgi:16S rRNA (cytidine1402-2'-O)-methyltransferase
VAPPAPAETDWESVETRLRDLLTRERLKDAVATVVDETGAPRRAVYQRALALKDSESE